MKEFIGSKFQDLKSLCIFVIKRFIPPSKLSPKVLDLEMNALDVLVERARPEAFEVANLTLKVPDLHVDAANVPDDV